MNVIAMGAHILDVLVRPVTDIPSGQETALVEQMRRTAAGTAAGTALTFAKLGAAVSTAGAVGADPAGDLLVSLLDQADIDTCLVVRKRAAAHTCSSKFRTSRPSFFASAGVRVARICIRACSSPKSRALPAIIQCSAESYVVASTTKGAGHH